MGQVIKDLEIEVQKANKAKKEMDMVLDHKVLELSRAQKELENIVSESVNHEYEKNELEQEKTTMSQMVSELQNENFKLQQEIKRQ